MTDLPETKELVTAVQTELWKAAELPLPALQERLKRLGEIKKKITARKEEITRPLREALASARDLFKPVEKLLEDGDAELRRLILAADEKLEKERAKIAKQVEKGEIEMDEVTDLTLGDTGGFRMVKKLVIKHKKLIPDKYWTIDEVKVRADLMDGKKVPGALLVEEKTVVNR